MCSSGRLVGKMAATKNFYDFISLVTMRSLTREDEKMKSKIFALSSSFFNFFFC